MACPDCDFLMHKTLPGKGNKTICPRCSHILMHNCSNSIVRSLAISLAGLFLYIPAISLPLLTFSVLGMHESGNILQTIQVFLHRGYILVAIAVFLFAVLFPLIRLLSLAITSVSLLTGYSSRITGSLFKLSILLEEWAMVEVFLLGIMITIIKMYNTAKIEFNVGIYCFSGLVLCTILSCLATCRESFWTLWEQKTASPREEHPRIILDPNKKTAMEHHLACCRNCGRLTLIRPEDAHTKQKCPRCGATVSFRRKHSISRTWACIITAALLLIPANILPIMQVDFLGSTTHSTIFDGIVIFFRDGSYFIALIILFASIIIPIFKIVGLSITLVTIHFHRPHFLRQKTKMFRFIEFIGRWSMLDIFVIALLGVYVNFHFFTTIEVAPAATFFCLAVIATMIAALSFDPRLMWDLYATPNQPSLHQSNSTQS